MEFNQKFSELGKSSESAMLSFFRRKSSESEGNILTRKITHLSMVDEVITTAEDALLKELGYANTQDFQETLYGL